MAISRTLAPLFAAALTFAAGSASARQLDLAKVPLHLGSMVKPSVVLTFDDSGSMREAYMPERTESRDIVRDGVTLCGFQGRSFFSAARNTVYFDPAVSYVPPLDHNGTRLPDVNFNAAPIDGLRAYARLSDPSVIAVPVVNLATQYFPTFQLNFDVVGNPQHRTISHTATPVYPGAPGSTSRCNAPVGNDLATTLPFATVAPNGSVSSAAFYYTYAGANLELEANYTAQQVSAAQRQNFANWYSYYRTRSLFARSAMAETFAPLGSTFRLEWQGLNQDPLDADSKVRAFDLDYKRAFFRWLFVWRASGETPLRAATERVGEFFKRSGNNDSSPYYDAASQRELTCRANFHLLITDGYWNEQNPLSDVTGDGDAAVIAGFPLGGAQTGPFSYAPGDGVEAKIYWNQQEPPAAWLNTPDGPRCYTPGGPSYAPCDPALADLAFHYWATDLRPDLADRVPRRWVDLEFGALDSTPLTTTSVASTALAITNREIYFNPKNDPANWQHVVNYIIGMGLAGTRKFPNDYTALRRGTLQWPWIRNASSRGVDDLWHAAINSRGEYMLADDGEGLRQELGRSLLNFEREVATASAVGLTSGVVSDASFAIRTTYDTGDWSGNVESFAVDANGIGEDALWEAGPQLTTRDPDSRVIFTAAQPQGSGVPFRWAALAPASDWQAHLNDDPVTAALDDDGLGERRLRYLRGDDADDAGDGGPFRARLSDLGSAVHSMAIVVGAPAGGYQDDKFPAGSAEAAAAAAGDGYADFRAETLRNRVAYVVANDGMLHAFDAGHGADPGTGSELWAYLPHELSRTIGKLTSPAFGLEPMVDSTPSVRDMFVQGRWRTVLVGGLRLGGQGIYALDITDPVLSETPAHAQRLVLWEFSDDRAASDPRAARLGYTYGKPNLVRLASGAWVVLLPGGYNNETPDQFQGDGSASLFVLSADDGHIIREINLPDTFGLAFATTGDFGDGDEFALAGDANGNLWHFDLSQDDPQSWTARKLYEPDAFTLDADDPDAHEPNPISSAPRIFGDPATGGAIAVFGTGKLIEPVDRNIDADAVPQRVIAVRFDPADPASITPRHLSDLVERTISTITQGDAKHYRIDSGALPANAAGWFFYLPEPGEGIINGPGAIFSTGQVLINSVRPNGGDPCEGALGGNFYVLDALTGSVPQNGGLFDTNQDGVVDASDDAMAIGTELARSIVEGTPGSIGAVGGGDAHIADFPSVKIPDPVWRRRAWREIR